ncbi:MAG: DUF1674 domain-containing protein [Woeseiaceae bacterium]|nr:DUF1674 domain-containing protein [Woeseiaceae bacterium]
MTSKDLKDTPDSEDSKPDTGVRQHNPAEPADDRPKEIGGRKGPDPTRYGDWEKNGRCIDF